MAVKKFSVGDESKIEATLMNGASAIDLTGATLVAIRFSVNGEAATQKDMTVTSAATGECEYTFTTAELHSEGHVRFEIKVTDSAGKSVTSDQHKRDIRNTL